MAINMDRIAASVSSRQVGCRHNSMAISRRWAWAANATCTTPDSTATDKLGHCQLDTGFKLTQKSWQSVNIWQDQWLSMIPHLKALRLSNKNAAYQSVIGWWVYGPSAMPLNCSNSSVRPLGRCAGTAIWRAPTNMGNSAQLLLSHWPNSQTGLDPWMEVVNRGKLLNRTFSSGYSIRDLTV